MEAIEIPTVTCLYCSHVWMPRVSTPKQCPSCGKRAPLQPATPSTVRPAAVEGTQTNGNGA